MKINPLDYIPLEVRKLQSMDKDSKNYKRGIKKLRLGIWQHILDIFKESKPGELFYPFKKKRRKYIFICSAITVVLMTVMIFLISRIGGDKDINEITKPEIIEVTIFALIFVIAESIAIFYAYKSKKVMDECIGILIDQTKIKCPHFSDELLESVSNTYQFTFDNHKITNTRQRCGCINCQTIFYTDQIKHNNLGSVICPYCSMQTVIAEDSGSAITKAFLIAMKEYWIDKKD